MAKVNLGEVAGVRIKKTPESPSITIIGTYANTGERFITYAPEYPGLVDALQAKKVKISAAPDNSGVEALWSGLLTWLPLFLFIGIYIFFMRQMQGKDGGRGGAMGVRQVACPAAYRKNRENHV